MLFSYDSNFKFSKIRDIIFISLIHICVYCNDLDLKIQMVGVGIMEVNYVKDKKFISKIIKKNIFDSSDFIGHLLWLFRNFC